MIGMTEVSVALVQSSWSKITSQEEAFVQLFYDRLFEINPELQSLFYRSMRMQGRKLMSMFSSAVESLDNLDKMMPSFTAAGTRHADYDVKGEHYAQVTEAWLFALSEIMADEFSDEMRDAWIQVLVFITAIMKANTDIANNSTSGE